VFSKRCKKYWEDVVEYQRSTQESFSKHNAVVFFIFGTIFMLLNLFIWNKVETDILFCYGISLFSAANHILYKKVLPKHKNWIVPVGNIYILILGKCVLSLNLIGNGAVSWTLLLCALISTSMVIIIPSYYIAITLILLVMDMVEYTIMNPDLVFVLYNLMDDLIIASFCIGINIIFSKMKYQELERKENLYSESRCDALTKLSNRRYLESYFESHVEKNGRCAILMLDLDNFKMANDMFGHKKGDEVLCQVADILRKNFRENDCIARLGGDELAVFLPEIPRKEVVMERVEHVLKCFPIVIEGETKVEVSVSMGVVFKEAGELPSYTRLCESADEAMYSAKKSGKAKAVITA
jgi:diguanylate cyclase (GGDEF)-like protein